MLNPRRCAGLTLIEMSLLIALFGVLSLYMVEHYLAESRLTYQGRLVSDAIHDTHGVIDAAHAWANDHEGAWPHDTTLSDPVVDIEQLVDDGYLRTVPELSFSGCARCRKDPVTQRFPACCHSLASLKLSDKTITTDPTKDNDLIVRFSVWGEHVAKLVATQVPLGQWASLGQDEYRITAQAPSSDGSDP